MSYVRCRGHRARESERAGAGMLTFSCELC